MPLVPRLLAISTMPPRASLAWSQRFPSVIWGDISVSEHGITDARTDIESSTKMTVLIFLGAVAVNLWNKVGAFHLRQGLYHSFPLVAAGNILCTTTGTNRTIVVQTLPQWLSKGNRPTFRSRRGQGRTTHPWKMCPLRGGRC